MGRGDGAQQSNLAYQRNVLPDVSRTFALTIPELPADLELAVGNAYLLCRIADTIEDDPDLDDDLRQSLHRSLTELMTEDASSDAAACLVAASSRLSAATSAAERALLQDTPRVVAIYQGLAPEQRRAIRTCVGKMCEGMPQYQHADKARGLSDLDELNRYCYHVAGVVGELLTDLFCHHHPAIASHRRELQSLAASFGQGLQMTNIIKDVWDDQARGYCWLPRDLFEAVGYDLDQLAPDHDRPRFQVALEQLIGIAHHHLRNALHYTLLIPSTETGIRRFCLWAVGLALLTLRKVHAHPDYVSPQEVKVSRRSVAGVVLATRVSVRSDTMLKLLFRLAATGLPVWPDDTPALAVDGRATR